MSGNTIRGNGLPQRAAKPGGESSVTKKGTIIYRVGAGAVRDDGDKLKISICADQATMRAALRMAIERYGRRIAANGSENFKEQILAAAVAENVSVTFDDPVLERRRQMLIGASITKNEAADNALSPGCERVKTVLEVDEATAEHLKRLAPGARVSVPPQGQTRTKGRSR